MPRSPRRSTLPRKDPGVPLSASQRPSAEILARLAPAVTAELARALDRAESHCLSLVATPIGNLADMSLRAIATLATADIVYAEDTRHSATLFAHYGLRPTVRPYHEHNAEKERPAILAALDEGKSVALISDAGTPLVSDPGYKLVRDCLAAGHRVTAIPGASATLAALVSSGLPSDAFAFAGFLPARSQARRTRIAELAAIPATLIVFETANRIAKALADLGQVLGERSAVVARELTKLNEEIARGSLTELAAGFAARSDLKGEIVIVVGPPEPREATDEQVVDALRAARVHQSLRDATRSVAEALGVAKSRVYDLALDLDDPSGVNADAANSDD
ncbi:MAG: 16S rRNA (cytidine(1402)-2'-O)-methyltransferase [Hyphomicrobiaceae bacterium]|nr:16S rRNA (cytidine(1402)-2'-O)-methyltransferase [Hyphomicrobiaceae bacterium]